VLAEAIDLVVGLCPFFLDTDTWGELVKHSPHVSCLMEL